MILQKLLTLAWREIYVTFTDRSTVLILLVTPLVLATIIGSAFSGLLGAGGGRDVPVSDVATVIVNQDQGLADGTNYGQIFVDLLVPPADLSPEAANAESVLFELTNAVTLDDPEAAREGVSTGVYVVAILIPSDFSARIGVSQEDMTIEPTTIEVIGNESAPISASVVTMVVRSIANDIAAGNITVASTIEALINRATSDLGFGMEFLAANSSGEFNPDFNTAFTTTSAPITIEQQTVSGDVVGFNPLVTFGSAQAVFFMTFTALYGVASLIDDRKDGTLQRLVMSPTPRWVILIGKIIGTFVTCVLQVSLLIIGLAVVGIVLQGELTFIWGNNPLGVFAVVLAVAFAGSGIGVFVSGIVKTQEQSNIVVTVIAMVFGILGGAFFTVQGIPIIRDLTQLTPNYWAVDAFTRLSQLDNAIGLNLIVLVALGAAFFTAGLFLANRRLEF